MDLDIDGKKGGLEINKTGHIPNENLWYSKTSWDTASWDTDLDGTLF